MFHFGKKKASVPELVLSAENIELYRGPLSDIPLSEKTILATCMDLYKDPQPCYIHRGAARQYLVAKLTDMITNGTPDFALLEEMKENNPQIFSQPHTQMNWGGKTYFPTT